jgi:hypothetical protein
METIEEVAQHYAENWEVITGLDWENTYPIEASKIDFIAGAKWQEKRMYSEEELERAYDLGVEQCIKRGCVYVRAMTDWDDIKEQFKKQ